MKNLTFITALVLSLILSGCDRYLEVKTYGKAIPKTSEEFSALLHNHLNMMDVGAGQVLLANATEIMELESVTDNFNATLTFTEGRVGLPIYLGSIINRKQLRYQRLYEVIRDANIIIDNMTETSSNDNQNVLGTAYALRAISYLHLLREYCEPYQNDEQLGLVLIDRFDMEERKLRSNYGATRSFIEQDFQKALSYPLDDEIYRFTKDVVKAYLARFYFWTHNWQSAAEISEELITKYPILTGDAYIKMMNEKHSQSGNVLIRNYLYPGDLDIEIANAQSFIKLRPVSSDFANLFVEVEKDIRYEMSLNKKRIAQKYINGRVRIAEMLLMAAESHVHLGNTDQALAWINTLRDNRIQGNEKLNKAQLAKVRDADLITRDALGKPLTPLMQLILDERRKELFLEGDRFYELKRNGRPEFWFADNGRKYTTQSYLYTFPLPRADIEVTPGLKQNEGYSF